MLGKSVTLPLSDYLHHTHTLCKVSVLKKISETQWFEVVQPHLTLSDSEVFIRGHVHTMAKERVGEKNWKIQSSVNTTIKVWLLLANWVHYMSPIKTFFTGEVCLGYCLCSTTTYSPPGENLPSLPPYFLKFSSYFIILSVTINVLVL